MSKSRRRRIPDAGTPEIESGHFYQSEFVFRVAPIGKPEQTVTFTLSEWQVRDMLTKIRRVGEMYAKRYDELAGIVRRSVQ